MSIRLIKHDGKELTIRGWADLTGLPHSTISHRLDNGWTEVAAITTPVDPRYQQGANKITKNEAELWLNEAPRSLIPKYLMKLVIGNPKNIGRFLRSEHRSTFDLFFAKDFVNLYQKQS